MLEQMFEQMFEKINAVLRERSTSDYMLMDDFIMHNEVEPYEFTFRGRVGTLFSTWYERDTKRWWETNAQEYENPNYSWPVEGTNPKGLLGLWIPDNEGVVEMAQRESRQVWRLVGMWWKG